MAKKKKGRKAVPKGKALARIEKPPARPPAVRRRTALETMHNLNALSDKMLWAGNRFARGYRAVMDLGSIASAIPDFDPWRPRGGIATAHQLLTLQTLDGVGRDYQQAAEAMDAHDHCRVDRSHGGPRHPTARGTIRRVVQAVACEERSCGELDRQAGKTNGWAAARLKEGLRIYLELFGDLFKREVDAWNREGAR